ncbi:MAG TPA: HAMP domain-containing sensor histidine kinase, partial [Aggregatilineaceae bacterium]|nr:HAMP domain-containing sensor histidine kinase [Aggregatilineaceae bacterium]
PQSDTSFKLILVQTGHNDRPREDGGAPPQGYPLPDELKTYPEMVTASQNAITVDERKDEQGQERLFTAAPVVRGRSFIGYVQMSEPASRLQEAVRERWEGLGFGVAGIAAVALLASVWLSTSLIRPLEKLRDSAIKFSQGELSHRVKYQGRDEIAAVAHAFNQMAEQVQAMIEEQRAFASNTSHELRTPLTTMRLRTEALRSDLSLDTETRDQYIQELDDELTRLSTLVNDLVLLSRFDAKRAETGQEQIDLERFAHSLHRTMAEQASEQKIDLRLDLAIDTPVSISASLNHLMILFRNLLENAIKYTQPGGIIIWSVSVEGNEAVLCIKDTGQGISPEHLPHVFERFYRADKSRSRSIPGTGLGLSLAKSIAEAYGAQIVITSPGIGQGTTVTVRWPLNRESSLR